MFDISKHTYKCIKCEKDFPFDVYETSKNLHWWTTRHTECGEEYRGALMYVKELDFDAILKSLKPEQQTKE